MINREKLARYGVTFRCETTALPEGGTFDLPPIELDGERITWRVFAEQRTTQDTGGYMVPTYLCLRTVIRAASIEDAFNRATGTATMARLFISFAVNAYVGPPLPWIAFPIEPTNNWRPIIQVEYEQRAQLAARNVRPFKPEIVIDFFNAFVNSTIEKRELTALGRAMDLYTFVLQNWNMASMIPAVHYLFIVAEGLTDIALPIYLESMGKSETQVLNETMAELSLGLMPEGLEEEAKQATLAIWSKLVYSGRIRDSANSKIKARARNQVVFADAPKAHQALSRATNGLEHGYETPHQFQRHVVAHVDDAAQCVRKWILRRFVADAQLIERLTTGQFALPLSNFLPILVVRGEFRCESDFIPVKDQYGAPYRLSIRWGKGTFGPIPKPRVGTLFENDVEMRLTEARIGMLHLSLREQLEAGMSLVAKAK